MFLNHISRSCISSFKLKCQCAQMPSSILHWQTANGVEILETEAGSELTFSASKTIRGATAFPTEPKALHAHVYNSAALLAESIAAHAAQCASGFIIGLSAKWKT